jgi:Ca2+-transporting ATPase
LVITKGAVEVLLDKIDERQSYLFLHLNANEAANEGYRVIGYAIKEMRALPEPLNVEVIESSLTFIGFAGMIDRQGAKQKRQFQLAYKPESSL